MGRLGGFPGRLKGCRASRFARVFLAKVGSIFSRRVMMDPYFFLIAHNRLSRLTVPPELAGDPEAEKCNSVLAKLLDEDFMKTLSEEFYLPPKWQFFVLGIAKLLFREGRLNDQKVLKTLKFLSNPNATEGIRWEFLWLLTGGTDGGRYSTEQVAYIQQVTEDEVNREVLLVLSRANMLEVS
ncbi:MAG TPA: hypothetical protein PKA63_02175 [Oligoflexia bacterium]|nr:hypothetical protein [Oligoflexia bacterium]HMP47458.1 hypothetical protein [Oligoflexia bacterium]